MPTVSHTHPGALRSRQPHTIVVHKEPQATGSEQTLRIVCERAGTGGIVYGGSRAYRTVILVLWACSPSTRIIRARLCYRHPSSAKLIGACWLPKQNTNLRACALRGEMNATAALMRGAASMATTVVGVVRAPAIAHGHPPDDRPGRPAFTAPCVGARLASRSQRRL